MKGTLVVVLVCLRFYLSVRVIHESHVQIS